MINSHPKNKLDSKTFAQLRVEHIEDSLISHCPAQIDMIAVSKIWKNPTKQSIGTRSILFYSSIILWELPGKALMSDFFNPPPARSIKKIEEARDKHNTAEGKLDINGKPLKFDRDL